MVEFFLALFGPMVIAGVWTGLVWNRDRKEEAERLAKELQQWESTVNRR